jgi:hypothetical protein
MKPGKRLGLEIFHPPEGPVSGRYVAFVGTLEKVDASLKNRETLLKLRR